ncbi:MAG TPA: stalk domain-containing protein [Clostridia bacterium]
MLRKIIVFISVILIISTSIPAFAESSISSEKGKEIIVNIDGAKVNFTDAKPYLSDTGRTMVPIRAVAEAMQAKVDWNGICVVKITKGDMKLEFAVGRTDDKYLYITNTELNRSKKVLMDSIPVVKNGRTFVPLRVINEAFGYQVNWDSENYTVEINTKNLTNIFVDNPALFEGSYSTMSDNAGEEVNDNSQNVLEVEKSDMFSSEASRKIEELGTLDYTKISVDELVYGTSYDSYQYLKGLNYPFIDELKMQSKVYQYAFTNKIVKEVKLEHSKSMTVGASYGLASVEGKLKFIYHGKINENYLKRYNGLVKIDTWYETPVYIILNISRNDGSIHIGQIVLGDTWTEVK